MSFQSLTEIGNGIAYRTNERRDTELLDDYNELYNWDYNEMCTSLKVMDRHMFLTHYETYHRLCDDYSTELVDEFSDYFDVDTIPHFEEMYEGQFETAQDFTEYYCTEVCEETKNIPVG